MARPRKAAPSYRYHAVSGRAVVTFNRKNFYLGEHGTPESRARYHALCSEYEESGYKTPTLKDKPQEPRVTVADVACDGAKRARKKFKTNSGALARFLKVSRLLTSNFGEVPASEFGPRRLCKFRNSLIEGRGRGRQNRSVSRKHVNQQIKDVVKMFCWAVEQELVEASKVAELKHVSPLARGEGGAETDAVKPVSIEVVRKTLPHLSPTLRAMVKIQLLTGMRPSEVIGMRLVDIDTSGDVWLYKPQEHKNVHRNKDREIALVPEVQKELQPLLEGRAEDSYLFSPREAVEWHRLQRANQEGHRADTADDVDESDRKESSGGRLPGLKYTSNSYRRAVERATERAGVERWTPYRLRHTAATETRFLKGIDAAQALLGHASPSTTEVYAKVTRERRIEAARDLARRMTSVGGLS